MAKYQHQFRCEVLTPDGPAIRSDAVAVRLPLVDGSIGVLAGRSAVMGLLGAGPLVIQLKDGTEERYYVAGGFAHVRGNVASVLAEEFMTSADLDLEQVAGELERARSMPAGSTQERERRRVAMARATAKMHLVPAPKAQGSDNKETLQ